MTAAGWHGKLPSLGDFATRRLAPAFVDLWDRWLSEGLAAMRDQHTDWLGAYLASPSWRFLLMPGALPGPSGETAWAGVLMPSVDRVGRYYPFTIAQPLAHVPSADNELDALWRWLSAIDDAAVDALHDDWTAEQLEATLARLGVPRTSPAGRFATLGSGRALPFDAHRQDALLLSSDAESAWLTRRRGHAFWYASGAAQQPALISGEGLSSNGLVQRLLGAGGEVSPTA